MIMKTLINTACVCFLIFTSLLLKSQVINIKSALDTSTILIGDQVRLRYNISQPKSAKVQFPVFNDTITGKIKVIKSLPPDSVIKGDSIHIRKVYVVTSFDSGSQVIPSISVPFVYGKFSDTLHSSAMQLMVKSLAVDTTRDIKDIKKPLTVPLSFRELLPYIAIGLGILLVAFLIWYIIIGRKKDRLFASDKIKDPPHIYALKELDNLRLEKLWQSSKEKLYYTRLTEIIRVYIEKRYGIYALEMTSDEIIKALNDLIIDERDSIELLEKMFSTADLVKFAKVKPLPDENEISLLNAYQFVNNTKPVVIPAAQINESETELNQ